MLAIATTFAAIGCSNDSSIPDPTGGTLTARSSTPAPIDGADTPVILNDDLILTEAQVATWQPGFSPIAGYEPKPGTVGARLTAHRGKSLGWMSGSSSDSLEVVVATPSGRTLIRAKKAASVGTEANHAGFEAAYFSVVDGIGIAQMFQGRYWIEVSSSKFRSGDDAREIYGTVMRNLQTAGG